MKHLSLSLLLFGVFTSTCVAQPAPSFLENKGQWNASGKYLLRSGNLNLWITDTGVVYDLYSIQNTSLQRNIWSRAVSFDSVTLKRHVVRMSFSHTLNPTSAASERQPGTANYFLGKDSTKWVTGARSFKNVVLRNLYKGIDAVFYVDAGQPRYDLVLQPGSDPTAIAMKFVGADSIWLNESGGLTIRTSLGNIGESGLFAYQQVDGGRQQIDCRFYIEEDSNITFILGKFDHSKPLVIDPLIYSTYLGGSRGDAAYAIAVDSFGSTYITGTTISLNFPISTGAYQTTNHGAPGYDAFITKLSPDGSSIVYSTYLGGSGGDFGDVGVAIALDSAGNAYVTGKTGSPDFPATAGAFQKVSRVLNPSYQNAFVTKLNASGTALIYSTYLGGSDGYYDGGGEFGTGIAVDRSGHAYVVGYSSSSDFPITSGAFQTANRAFTYFPGGAGSNSFVLKLNPRGTGLDFSTYLGGTGDDRVYGLAIDSAGMVYVAGRTASLDFPVTTNAFQATNHAASLQGNAFFAEFNATGTALNYATYLGGAGDDICNGIALDPSGNVYLTGSSSSPDFPMTAGAYQTSNRALLGGTNVFVTKLNPAMSGLLYSTYIGGAMQDVAARLAIDGLGNAYLTGSTSSTDFPVTPGAFQTVNHAKSKNTTGFVTKLSSAGNALLYSTYLGGSGSDESNDISLDRIGFVYVTGTSTSRDFPTTSGAFQTTNHDTIADGNTAFVTKLSLLSRYVLADTSVRNFGSGSICRTADTTIVFQNLGGDTLLLRSIQLVGKNFVIIHQPSSTLLLPGESDTVIVAFQPTSLGADTATLRIATSAANDSLLIIPISARTIVPPHVHLLCAMSKASAYTTDTTTLSIFPDTVVSNVSLISLRFTVIYNSDLLTLTNTQTAFAGVTVSTPSQASGGMSSLIVTFTGNNLRLDPKQPFVLLHYRVTIADSSSSRMTVGDPILNGGTDSSYERCILTAGGSSTQFTLLFACGDTMLRNYLGRQPLLQLVGMSPDPVPASTNARITISLDATSAVNASYRITSATGSEVNRGNLDITSGLTSNQIILPAMPEGAYFLSINAGTNELTEKFVVRSK